MIISGKAKVCGIMAYPVEHSFSPLMHNFYARELGLDFAYVPFKVPEDQVEAAIKGAYALNLAGMNITVPYKQRVIPYLKDLDPAARAIGAVNTLVRVEGGFKGHNTDGPGLWRAMKEAGLEIKGRDCLLIGAGGAAKAAAYVLGSQEAASVTILNRNESRARELALEMNRCFGKDFMTAMALEDYKSLPDRQWLAVQTTSVGMHPHTGRAPVEDKAFYRGISCAVDIVYTPARTRFMAMVEEAGGRAIGGLDMLIYQGIQAFELWNPGCLVLPEVVEKARRLMRKELEK